MHIQSLTGSYAYTPTCSKPCQIFQLLVEMVMLLNICSKPYTLYMIGNTKCCLPLSTHTVLLTSTGWCLLDCTNHATTLRIILNCCGRTTIPNLSNYARANIDMQSNWYTCQKFLPATAYNPHFTFRFRSANSLWYPVLFHDNKCYELLTWASQPSVHTLYIAADYTIDTTAVQCRSNATLNNN